MKTNDDKPLVPDHLSDDEILSYLDGEVGAELQTGTQAHLEGCWDCRARLSSFERSIENFLQVRQRMMPTDLPPSGPALKLFRERLHHHQSLSPTHSFLRDRINGLRLSSRRLIKAFDLSSSGKKDIDALTPAEIRVLRLIGQYKTTKEIAEILFISPRTVESHRSTITQKLSLRGSHSLMRYALQHLDEMEED